MTSQSNAINMAIIMIGTTSILASCPFGKNINNILPSKSYYYKYYEQLQGESYLLKHEVMNNQKIEDFNKQLVEIPIVQRIKIKLNKPTPLEFKCIEDKDGFI